GWMPFLLGEMRESREDPCAGWLLDEPFHRRDEGVLGGGRARGRPALRAGRLGGGCLLACEPLRERTEGGLVALDLRQGLGVLRGQLQLDRQLVADQLGLGVLSALGGSGEGLGGGL